MPVKTVKKPLWEQIYDTWGTSATDADRVALLPQLSPSQIDQLKQLASPTYDGYVMSKQLRFELVALGLVECWNGINFCNRNGYCVLDVLGYLKDSYDYVGGVPPKRKSTR